MKKTIVAIAFVCCTTLFAQKGKKEMYIKEHLPLLEHNLTEPELKSFIKSMKFNGKGALVSQDLDLLEKGGGEQFGTYFQYIVTQRTGVANPITIGQADGTEMVIETDGTISFDNRNIKISTPLHNSQIEGDKIQSFQNKTFLVDDLTQQDGLFVVTSTSCGPCLLAYPNLNELANDAELNQFAFTALYRDSFEKIATYKTGKAYENFGELETPWNVFSSDELIKRFDVKYDFKSVPFVFIKKNGKIVYQKYGIKIEDIKKTLKAL